MKESHPLQAVIVQYEPEDTVKSRYVVAEIAENSGLLIVYAPNVRH